jgi:hypothetical protein
MWFGDWFDFVLHFACFTFFRTSFFCHYDHHHHDHERILFLSSYSAPDPWQPYVPEHASLTVAGVTALALPGLRAMSYALGESGR